MRGYPIHIFIPDGPIRFTFWFFSKM